MVCRLQDKKWNTKERNPMDIPSCFGPWKEKATDDPELAPGLSDLSDEREIVERI